MNQLRTILRKPEKGTYYYRGAETFIGNRCSYQAPVMVRTNASTNYKHRFYDAMAQAISQGRGYVSTNIEALCAHFLTWDPLLKLNL